MRKKVKCPASHRPATAPRSSRTAPAHAVTIPKRQGAPKVPVLGLPSHQSHATGRLRNPRTPGRAGPLARTLRRLSQLHRHLSVIGDRPLGSSAPLAPGLVFPDTPRSCLAGTHAFIRPAHRIANGSTDQGTTEAITEVHSVPCRHLESLPAGIFLGQHRHIEAGGV